MIRRYMFVPDVHGPQPAVIAQTGACNSNLQFKELIRGPCSYVCKPDFSGPTYAWAWTLVSGIDGCAARL